MKKMVRIYMRKKEHDILLTYEQAEKLFDSPSQLVKLTDEKGQWTGVVINKAEIITSNRDFESEKQLRYNPNQLPEPKLTDEEKQKIKESLAKIRETYGTIRPQQD